MLDLGFDRVPKLPRVGARYLRQCIGSSVPYALRFYLRFVYPNLFSSTIALLPTPHPLSCLSTRLPVTLVLAIHAPHFR